MKIKNIKINHLEKPKQYYDVIGASPEHNFLIKTNSSYIVSHNCAFFDEISFIKNQDVEKQKQKAYDMIDTAIGGMKTRFVYKGKNPTLLMLASSKRSDKSFLEEHMKKKLKSEKENVYVSDGSVWQVKPPGTYSDEMFKVALGNKFLQSMVIPDGEDEHLYEAKGYKILQVPVDFRADFIDDIDRALCDFAGISSSSISKYINAQAVTDVVTDRIKNPFTSEILEIGNGPDDEAQYYNFFDLSKIDPALRSKPLFIHLDMSISGDKTGIAGVFIRGKKPSTNAEFQSNDLFYSLAFAVSIKAPKGRQVSFDKNRNFIYWLKEKGFNIKGITTDTFQSYDTGQTLQAKGYPYQVLSVDRVDSDRICKPYQYFKNTIYDKRIELFDQKLLFREITELERNIDTGKVDHPEDGCFTGETKVQLVDGRSLSFYDLVDEFDAGKENYVYSINLETKRVEPKRIVKAWLTKKDQQLVRLTFDNGEVVECTLNHRFMLRNGEYIEAQNMIPGESLMPLYTRYPEKGGLKDYRLYYEPFEDKWHFEHRQFAKEILDTKHLVHHKNCIKDDNTPTNLIWCSRAAHEKLHADLETGAQSIEAKAKRSESLKQWHADNKNTAAYEERAEKTRQAVLNHNLEKYGHNKTIDIKNHINDIETTFNVKWDDLTESEKDSYGVKLSRIQDPTIQARISAAVSQNHAAGKYKNAKKALAASNQKMKMLRQMFPKVDKEKFFELFGFRYETLPSGQSAVWTNRYRQKLYELTNHKLVSIEFIDKRADVYDIEVEDNHNFALAAGVFVHNSKDACDAVCGAVFNASHHAEEFAYDYGESLEGLLRANDTSGADDVNELTLKLEDELRNMRGVFKPKAIPGRDPGTTEYSLLTDDIIIL